MRCMVRFAAVAAFLVLLSICGCGEDNGGYDGAEAEELFQQGLDYLESNLPNEDPENQPPWEWTTDMSAANGYFEDALDRDPNHAGALLFSALTRMGMVFQEEQLGTIMDDLFPESGERSGGRRGQLLLRVSPPDMRAVPTLWNSWRRDPFAFSDLQAFIEDVALPALLVADDRLSRFEDGDHVVIIIVETEQVREEITIEIDATDVYLAHTALDLMQAALNMMLAYDIDVEDGETLEYLIETDPDFLTLRPGDNMLNAYGELVEAAQRIHDAGWSMSRETDPQDDDIFTGSDDVGYVPMGAGMPDSLMTAGDRMSAALSDGITLNPWEDSGHEPGAPDIDVLVDIEELFMDPLNPLTDYFPNHEWPHPDSMLVTEPLTFPDPTFDGITPDMTNELWRPIFDWLEGE